MKRFIENNWSTALGIVYCLICWWAVAGCGAVERTGDFLLRPGVSGSTLRAETGPDRASLESITLDPSATKGEKRAAAAGIKAIDAAVSADEKSKPGDNWLTVIFGGLAAIGVPYASIATIGSRRLGRAFQQTVAGIERARAKNPSSVEPIEAELSKSQDADVKELVAQAKGKA